MHLIDLDCNRRKFLLSAGATGLMLAVSPALAKEQEKTGEKNEKEDEEGEVGPNEDLMREHGVLRRAVLCYREGLRRIDAKEDFDIATIHDVAQLIRTFVEDYHEKLEEQSIFPRFREKKTLTELVDTLQKQHEAGRALTETVLQAASREALADPTRSRNLTEAIAKFLRMYEPHAAREDTVLFPALRKIVSDKEYDAMGDEFEKREREMFGEDGFEKMVDKVAGIERRLGIYDLAQFTPAP